MIALELPAASNVAATALQMWGAFAFGVMIGWFVYYVNRHRTGDVTLADVGTLVAAIGGGAVLVIFPAGTDLFGAYGLGLAAGFFAYLVVLLIIVAKQPAWTFEWFLDGRAPKLGANQVVVVPGPAPLGGNRDPE